LYRRLDATVPKALRDARITAVRNCTEVSNDLDSTEFRCLRLNQPDGAEIYPEVLRGFFDWMMLARRDHLFVLIHCREGSRALPRVLCTFERHYNAERPHRGIELRVPDITSPLAPVDEVPPAQRRNLVGGLIHEYYGVVAWWISFWHPSGSGERERGRGSRYVSSGAVPPRRLLDTA
jgi:hypothetical protein